MAQSGWFSPSLGEVCSCGCFCLQLPSTLPASGTWCHWVTLLLLQDRMAIQIARPSTWENRAESQGRHIVTGIWHIWRCFVSPQPTPHQSKPTLGLHCSLEMRARKGMGEQPQGRDVVRMGNTNSTSQRAPAGHTTLPWAGVLEGTEPTEHHFHQQCKGPAQPRPSFRWAVLVPLTGCDSTSSSLELSTRLASLSIPESLHSPLTLLPLGSEAQMAHSSLGECARGEGG